MREATTEIWKRFESGQEHHRRLGLYEKSARAYRFFLGDQWYGMSEAGRELPVMNIVAPTIKNKVATVAQGQVSIHYLPIGGAGGERGALRAAGRAGGLELGAVQDGFALLAGGEKCGDHGRELSLLLR